MFLPFSQAQAPHCFLPVQPFLFVSISNAYGQSGKHKPVGHAMKYGVAELPYHDSTFKHASQVRRIPSSPRAPRWLSEELRVPLSLLKWYKILMSALWISFSWNLAKALTVCERGDMHEKENSKTRRRQEDSLMKYIPKLREKEDIKCTCPALLFVCIFMDVE